MKGFKQPYSYKLIYIFRINDETHKGLVKIGDTTINTDLPINELLPSCTELNLAAKKRITSYITTASIEYELLYTELAIRSVKKNGVSRLEAFSDHYVHNVLKRSGIKKHEFHFETEGVEWFKTDLETAKRAITAVKEGRSSLNANEITIDDSPIIFRPEQKEAIKATIKQFKKGNRMLWNAKMRFGKTLTALEVAKELGFHTTLIFTHRPVVNEGWFEDFNKIFKHTNYRYGSKTRGERIEQLFNQKEPFVYFASLQDLRGSTKVGGKFNKNDEIFNLDWDFIIVDEAHEGTQTTLGQKVIDAVINNGKKLPKLLELSGTPFNLLVGFKDNEIYTWDYMMEQKAKLEWAITHFGDSNPYEELPQLEIFIYNLGKVIRGFDDENSAFNFKEFFRTWTGDVQKDYKKVPSGCEIGDFVHKDDVKAFLNLLVKADEEANYPFANEKYREYYRHTLWMVPGVKEAKALSKLLQEHPVFSQFNIVNVAGDGDKETDYENDLSGVRKAIGDHPEETYSITISCGRLTTGVTVPEWTAVLMLAGSFSTSATSYLQTIFRVQNPANINGMIKERCSVFDFAPDRALEMASDVVHLSPKTGRIQSERVVLGQFLNYCPVIAIEGSNMKSYDVNMLMQKLKKIYVDKVVRSGFDDKHIYNDNLLKLDGIDFQDFEELKKIIGTSKQAKKIYQIDINNQGFTDEEYEELKLIEDKPKRQLTPEEIAMLEEKKKKRDMAARAMSILRGISIRIPLLIYGADVSEDAEITVENFVDIVKDSSWAEFMPKGVTKDIYRKFAKYYEQDIFVAAGRKIRETVKLADDLTPQERVIKIAQLFSTFKNPDKETVLTPWRVVNLHLGNTLGGYNFYNDDYTDTIEEPRFIDLGKVTHETFANENANILEINSKTGLYPLYATFSIYQTKLNKIPKDQQTFETQWHIWNETVKDNIYIICKTSMAKSITRRTLLGYREGGMNAHAFDDLIMQIKEKSDQLLEKVLRGSFWDKGVKEMKFDAVIGNPPYHEEVKEWKSTTNGQPRRKNIFHYFQIFADKLSKGYVSLIYPGARWIHRFGKGVEKFGLEQINDRHLVKLFFYPDATEIFKSADIGDGISIVLKNVNANMHSFEYFYIDNKPVTPVNLKHPNKDLISLNPSNESLINKVSKFVEKYKLGYLHDKVLSQKLFGIESCFVGNNPDKVREYTSKSNIDYSKEIKLFANDKPGKAGRSKWYIVDKSVILSGRKYIDEWQVVVSSANAGGQKRSNQISIIDNHSAFGRSRVALSSFKTEIEAKNFYKYCKTNIIRYMFLMTDEALTSLGKKVPDLKDYTNNNKLVDFSKDLNKQLYDLIGLEDDEIEFIEKTVKTTN